MVCLLYSTAARKSSGIATADGNHIDCYKNMGLVTHVYNEETIQNLKGHIAIGHNRYSTSEGSHIKHAQPVVIEQPIGFGPQRQPALRKKA